MAIAKTASTAALRAAMVVTSPVPSHPVHAHREKPRRQPDGNGLITRIEAVADPRKLTHVSVASRLEA